jgi:hypothetical protein
MRLAVLLRIQADQLALFVEVVMDLPVDAERLDGTTGRQVGELERLLLAVPQSLADVRRRRRIVERRAN